MQHHYYHILYCMYRDVILNTLLDYRLFFDRPRRAVSQLLHFSNGSGTKSTIFIQSTVD